MTTRTARSMAALLTVAVMALGALAAGCSSSDDDPASSTSTDQVSPDPSTGGDDDTTSSFGQTETTAAAATTDTTDTSEGEATTTDTSEGEATTTLPGDPFEGFTSAGDELAVVGVAHDDVLNVRDLPGDAGTVITTAGPTDTGLVATGQGRLLPTSIWYEVTVGGTTGWVSTQFVGFEGVTIDDTAAYLASEGPLMTETLVDMADAVAEYYASDEPPSNIVQSVAPTVGDLGEITYDVIGLGDDALLGYRVHIFAVEGEGGESWDLKSIELTSYCGRGTTDDGRCL